MNPPRSDNTDPGRRTVTDVQFEHISKALDQNTEDHREIKTAIADFTATCNDTRIRIVAIETREKILWGVTSAAAAAALGLVIELLTR